LNAPGSISLDSSKRERTGGAVPDGPLVAGRVARKAGLA
jgi:hypothetical protein